jgi:hypothetical protein
MAQEGTPVVRGGYLRQSGERPIPLGSARWFSWLETARLFSYHSTCGRRMTLRQEKRRHSRYWYAYLKKDRQLHNAYAGRSAALTPERLAVLLEQLWQLG